MVGPIGRYVGVTFGVSWGAWGGLSLLGVEPFGVPGVVLFALGGLGPAVGGVGLTLRAEAAARREYWRRLVEVSRLGPRWAVLLLSLPALVTLGGLAGSAVLGASVPPLGRELPPTPTALLGFLVVSLAFGPLPEELGWRGYALDPLLERYSALGASLLLGGLWAVWHLPLFLLPGTYQAGLGVGTPAFFLFGYFILAYSVLYTWAHVHTRRSILAAVVFHFAINASGELLPSTLPAELVSAALLGALVVVVLAREGPATLRGFRARGR